jgi:hypothetical protein
MCAAALKSSSNGSGKEGLSGDGTTEILDLFEDTKTNPLF